MKRLIIIGAGGFGREVLSWAKQCSEFRKDWGIGGFLDANPQALAGYSIDLPILGNSDSYQPTDSDLFICAIANPAFKRKCVEAITNAGGQFARLIHPSVVLGDRVELAEGVILCPRAVLTCDISVGAHTALNLFTAIGHDASTGRYCQMHSYSELCGGVRLEDEVLVGSHATLLPGTSAGKGALIGAGSVVVSKVPSGTSVFGAPARKI